MGQTGHRGAFSDWELCLDPWESGQLRNDKAKATQAARKRAITQETQELAAGAGMLDTRSH